MARVVLALAVVILASLEKDPARRPASANELASRFVVGRARAGFSHEVSRGSWPRYRALGAGHVASATPPAVLTVALDERE